MQARPPTPRPRARFAYARAMSAALRIDPTDWHVPTLAEVFALATAYPDGGPIFLDTKLPDDPDVAARLGAHYLELFVRFPDMRGRAFIACPDRALLEIMKEVFAAAPGFADFRDFALDHEELSAFALGHDVAAATPLRGAVDNAWLAIGAPYLPLAVGGFDDLLALVRTTLAQTRAGSGPHAGRRLCVWTIDDDDEMGAVAELAPDVILTNRPARLTAILDERFGPRGADPRRPRAMCPRGGPDGPGVPENTLPAIELGLRLGDGLEIDVCAATDGPIVFHDNDPENAIAVLRRSGGGGVGEFKPVFTDHGRDLANRRLDQLTIAEIQACYGYARDEKGAVATAITGLGAIGRLIRDRFD